LHHTVADLGASPLANSLLDADGLHRVEPTYPLCVYVCEQCRLVQIEEFELAENIFHDYAYFSSYSQSWLEHCERYARSMVERFELGARSKVVEIASNDGYLLQYFQDMGIDVLGVEPAQNVADAALARGIPTEVAFFARESAQALVQAGHSADLIAANNVLAHVPDINGFVAAFAILLKPHGVLTVEFPHLLNLIEQTQFDTIYHEHFSYLSFVVVERIFAHHGLTVFDVDTLPTHGGSLRVYAQRADAAGQGAGQQSGPSAAVAALRAREEAAGLDELSVYADFQAKVLEVKLGLLEFLIDARRKGATVAGYGAPAKGNTLLNYCGIGPELLPYTVDLSPHKQGRFLPGTRIPIEAPRVIEARQPDYVLILPWNLRDEISTQMGAIRQWGGQFVVPIPRIEVF